MPLLYIVTYLQRPGFNWEDISKCVDITSSYEVTDAIESPSEANDFVAPDVQVKVHAGAPGEFQLSWFDGIQPESTDYYLQILVGGVCIFYGFILPTSIQIDTVERWLSFTAAGMGAKLARHSAEDSELKRTVVQWHVKSCHGTPYRANLVIEAAASGYTCEFVTDDVLTIAIGGGDTADVKVISVTPDGATPPYASFTLVVEGAEQAYAEGSVITLATPYLRNVNFDFMVAALFRAAGLREPQFGSYGVLPISGAAGQFASRPCMDGLSGVPLAMSATVGVDAFGYPVIGTTAGTYVQHAPPLGPWTPDSEYFQGAASWPVNWTRDGVFTGMGYMLYGPREESYPFSPTDPDSDQVYVKWRYWLKTQVAAPPFVRFGISLRVGNTNASGTDFPFVVELLREESYDGFTWARTHTQSIVTGSTTTNLHEEVWETCDVDVTGTRASQSRVIFTYPTTTSPETYAVGIADPTDLSGYAEILTDARGRFMMNTLYQSDVRRGNTPVGRPFLVNESGVPVIWQTPVSLPNGFAPQTMTLNRSDNLWYALAANETDGVILLSYTSNRLDARSGWVPPQIEPPGTSLYINLDLVAIRANTTSGPWPMMAIAGTNVWWIAYSFAGVIPYADVEGLSCGEALAQLATLVDARFWLDATTWPFFLSRGLSAGQTIASGTTLSSFRIDDGGCITIRRSSVFWKSYRYASVANERDEAIFGEAGDKNFKGTEQGLERTNRFVTTVSMARALSEQLLSYLGRKLEAVEVTHEWDGRIYGIGRTFTALRGGVLRTYQIIESTPMPIESRVRVLGLEL